MKSFVKDISVASRCLGGLSRLRWLSRLRHGTFIRSLYLKLDRPGIMSIVGSKIVPTASWAKSGLGQKRWRPKAVAACPGEGGPSGGQHFALFFLSRPSFFPISVVFRGIAVVFFLSEFVFTTHKFGFPAHTTQHNTQHTLAKNATPPSSQHNLGSTTPYVLQKQETKRFSDNEGNHASCPCGHALST